MISSYLIFFPISFVVVALVIVLISLKKVSPPKLAKILFLTFILRVILGITLNYLDLIPDNLVNDAKDYHHDAKEHAHYFVGENDYKSLKRPGFGKDAFSILLSFIYIFGGPFIFIGIIFSSLLSHYTIINLYKFGKIYFNNRVAYHIAIIISILPSFLFFSFNTFREPLIILLVSSLMVELAKYFKNIRIKKMKLYLTFILLLYLRFYLGFILISLIIITIFFKKSKLSFSLNFISLISLISFTFYFFGTIIVSNVSKFLPIPITSMSINSIEIMRNAMMGGIAGGIGSGSSYLHDYDINNIFDLIKLIIIGPFNFAFGPLPLHAHNTSALFISFENILLLLLFLNGLRYIKILKFNDCLVMLIPFGIIIIYGLIITDYGTALRMKQQALPWLLTLPLFIYSNRRLNYK